MTRITGFTTEDIRFPTSRDSDGSDAMNPDPDYSAAYIVFETDHPDGHEGHGLTFTIGRGNDLCVGSDRPSRDEHRGARARVDHVGLGRGLA